MKQLLLVSVFSIGLVVMAFGFGELTLVNGGEAQADTPPIKLEILACPPTVKFKAQIDTVDVGAWHGEHLPFDRTAKFADVFVDGGNQVRCRYTPDTATGFKPSVIRTFTGKTCTASADNKTFSCK